MPNSRFSKLEHGPIFHQTPDGSIHSVCELCGLQGPQVDSNFEIAEKLFWAQHYLAFREEEPKATYEDGYRKGVEDARRKMPRCPRSEGDPLATHKSPNGWWSVMCPICLSHLNRSTMDYGQAISWFWKKHDFENKEKTMYVPSDPHEAYKFGVRQATEPIIVANLADQDVNDVLSDRRKKLLTKKVTKWVAVAISSSNGKPYYAQGYFQDSKKSALANKTGDPGDPTFLGVYPIEIEVPI